MFKIKSDVLQEVVKSLARGARKTQMSEKFIFVKTINENEVSFYFNGDEISVERIITADIVEQIGFASTVREIDQKVSGLPKEQDILVEKIGNFVLFKWGKNNFIKVEVLPKEFPVVQPPNVDEKIVWPAGTLHGITKMMVPFAAMPNSEVAKRVPAVGGPNFSKDEKSKLCIVRASDSHKGVTVKAGIEWFDSVQLSIASSTMQALSDLLSEEKELEIGIHNNSTLVFKQEKATIVCRTLEGKFPNIDQSYLKTAKSTLHFDRLELIEVCRRAKIVSQHRVLSFKRQEGKVYAVIPGVLEQHLGCAVEGEFFEFSVDYENLELAALMYRSDEVSLLLNGSLMPITVKQEGLDDINVVVLPIKL